MNRWRVGFAVAVTSLAAACGARTGFLDGEVAAPGDDSGTLPVMDASVADVRDARVADARTLDATDARVVQRSCVDAGITYVYLMTAQSVLLRFYPPTAQIDVLYTVSCGGETETPFSMGVDREGMAWVVFRDGTLFRVDTGTGSCTFVPYATDQLGWNTFGMAFVGTSPTDESLYVAESNYTTPSQGLGIIDVTSNILSVVGAFAPPLSNAVELTGTGDGRLFAFSLDSAGNGSHVSQVDRKTAAVLSDFPLPSVGGPNSSFAFAYWGGDFYLFTAPDPQTATTVSRYRPSDKSVVVVGRSMDTVVGAGVSTCAPE